MDREMLAEWLRDIAQHIEEESPLIRKRLTCTVLRFVLSVPAPVPLL